MYSLKSLIVSTVSLLAAAASVHAAVVLSPESVLRNDFGSFSASFPIERTINQTGLTAGSTFESGVTDYDTYVASNPTHTAHDTSFAAWYGASFAPQNGIIDFDLGDTYTIESLAFFSNPLRAMQSITIYTSNDPLFTASTQVGTFVPYYSGSGSELAPLQNINLVDTVAQYVRFDVSGYYGNNVGMGEVAFGVVPEPTTYAMLAGAAGLGLVMLRRRRQS
ncbi:MAG: PEP-CTERM sorting domain-containing protein [Verrucomicrobiota bacterium JB022]|nr:PEP-CTERM sorting domain-containing protein [Verrucomicrobiota bacterium JB022]